MVLAKFGLAKCGQLRMATSGLAKFGRDLWVRGSGFGVHVFGDKNRNRTKRTANSTADSRCLPGSRFVKAATNYSATAGCLLAVVCTQSAQLDQYAALLTQVEMSAPKIRVRHSFKEAVWFTAYSSVCAGGNGSQEEICPGAGKATAQQLADPGQKVRSSNCL